MSSESFVSSFIMLLKDRLLNFFFQDICSLKPCRVLSNILAQIYAFVAKAQRYYDMLITKTAGDRERCEKAS